MTKQCVFYWGSEPAEGGGSFALQAGIAPSSGILRFTLGQASRINQINTLLLTDFESVSAPFRNCRVTRATVGQSGGGGRWYEVQFQDRRWMWGERCFAIYGEYNLAVGEKVFARTMQQLAVLCLEAMGEVGYNVSLLPDFPGPPVQWDASDPAVELQRLCESVGCLVTLSPQDRVVIARDGFGRTPQSDPRQMDFTASTEPPVVPKTLVFEGGQLHVQHDVVLQPVAKEEDRTSPNYGKHVSIYDVSYYKSPVFGLNGVSLATWAGEVPGLFAGVYNAGFGGSGVFDPAARRARQLLAQRDVWRKYAVLGPIQLPIPPADVINRTNGKALTVAQVNNLKPYFKINVGEGWRLLPWNDKQNLSSVKGTLVSNLGIFGYHFLHNANSTNTAGKTITSGLNVDPDINLLPLTDATISGLQIPPDQYKIDHNAGIVEFTQNPMFFRDSVDGNVPAIIRLRTSFPIRDRETAALICPQWWVTPGSPIATNLAKIVKRSDIYFEYDAEKNDNSASFKSQAGFFLASELNQYTIGTGYSAPYKGFVVDIPVDGVVRTVAWDATPESGGMTHIDYNMERPEAYLTLTEIHARRMATWNAFKAADDERKSRMMGARRP